MNMNDDLRKTSLLFLIKKDEILLAMKKRGFGAGRWNGVGGKPDPEEEIEDTATRECEEEINVTPIALKKVAKIDFLFPEDKAAKGFNQQVHVFLCNEWEGDPEETEEMKPEWFKLDKVPYDEMWADDKFWLPLVIEGKTLKAEFTFDDNDQVTKQNIVESPIE